MLIVALPLTIIWRQGTIIDDRAKDIVTLKTQLLASGIRLTEKEEEISVLGITMASQSSVIGSLLQTGRMIDLPVGTFTCTAYEASTVSCGQWADGITSEGVPVGLGIAAADHQILPPGTVLYVHALKAYFIVLDRGGAIKGNRLDLYTVDVKSARQFGVLESKVSIIKGDNYGDT